MLEEKEEGIEESRSSVDAGGLNNDSMVVVEDELGLNDSSNDINAMTTKSKFKCRNEDALDYIRAMVRTTLPPDKKNPVGSGNNGATSYLEASPGQRSKVQFPTNYIIPDLLKMHTARYQGLIKDYDGDTIMECCYIHPSIH